MQKLLETMIEHRRCRTESLCLREVGRQCTIIFTKINETGRRLKHEEDLKMAAFKKLFPLELQNQHVLSNMRLITYETQNSVEIR